MELIPLPLTKEAFAPFGDVIDVPKEAGRTYYEDALGNLRPNAKASLSMTFRLPTPDRPLKSPRPMCRRSWPSPFRLVESLRHRRPAGHGKSRCKKTQARIAFAQERP